MTVAWVYPQPGAIGWMRTRDFSFGASILEDDPPEELRAILDPWIDRFSKDTFADDVSSRGTQAWAVSQDDALHHQDLLIDRLTIIISELASY